MEVQLNFLGNYLNAPNNEQLKMFDDALKVIPAKEHRLPKYSEVESFFNTVDKHTVDSYRKYWDALTPKNTSSVFQRWLFAFMSVHTSWKSNIAGYTAIKKWWQWVNREEELKNRIHTSRVGMHNNRTKYICEFTKDFWENLDIYERTAGENWTTYRNRLEKRVLGLGPAKTSFSLEMCFPNDAHVACMDTHLFQVYGLDQTRDSRMYEKIEAHWLDMSRMWNIPPYIARCIYWDRKQNQQDSSYWAHVLE